MNRRPPTLVATLVMVGAVLAAGLAVAVSAAPAQAASRITVTNDRGGNALADSNYQTKLTIRGNGFQALRNGFGGVYVMFGWVSDPKGGSWKPSRGGLTGQDYRYIPDAEDKADNKGYLQFVAFPGSDTASEAADVMSDSGAFSINLTIPGPVFQSVDRQGRIAEVDCRKVTCGVITIGAHNVKSPPNETFTPVRFGEVYSDGTQPETQPGDEPGDEPTSDAEGTTDEGEGADAAPKTRTKAKPGKASLLVDRATAVQGRALAFVAQGFSPGEQVLAVLDDGVVGLGPITAGTAGEVAAVLALPADLDVGTHELRVTGAASGRQVTELFPVAAGDQVEAPATPAASADEDGSTAGTWFLLAAVAIFALAGLGALLTLARRRRVTP